MGLLDQVIGQVVGQMMGGGASSAPANRTGGAAGGLPGGLGDLLGGAAGRYSPLVMALLALLASRHLQNGAGGYGSVLHDIFGRITGSQPAGGDPEATGSAAWPGGTSSDATPMPSNTPRSGGGFLNDIGAMLDKPGASSAAAAPGGGLEELADRFRQSGQGEAMDSWIGSGPNQPITPGGLEQALGPDILDSLTRGTGLDRGDLLQQLTQALPQVIDKLSPHGRLPTGDDQRSWI